MPSRSSTHTTRTANWSPKGWIRLHILKTYGRWSVWSSSFSISRTSALSSPWLAPSALSRYLPIVLEDASVNFLILVALGWSARRRAKVGMSLAGILLIPGLATLWTAWEKFIAPSPPEALALSLTGIGALAVNLACAIMLTSFRRHSGSLTKAAFLSARSDALANIAIIGAGLLTAYTSSAWPDLIVGLAVAAMNADAAREVWKAAREKHKAAEARRSATVTATIDQA